MSGGPRTSGSRPLTLAGGGLLRRNRATIDLPHTAADASRAVSRAWLAVGVAAAFLFALLVRLVYLDRSYDVFIDEITYFFISRAVADGGGVTLHGQPFFLHPPLFFFLQGPWIAVLHPSGPLIDQVLSVRPMQAGLAAVTAVGMLLIATRVGGWRAGLVAFLLFAVDPFTVRINSRNLLETTALMLVVLGYLALLWGPLERGSVGRGRVLLTGAAFGGALLTKEMTFFLTLLPLGLLFLSGRALPRRVVLGILLVEAVVYSAYPVGVLLAGLGPEFLTVKLSGLLRFLGVMKTTGFVHGGPSFVDAVVRNLDVYATTYVLIGLGIPASLVLAWKGDEKRRVLGVLGLSAYGLLAYSIGFGTLEEQFFYFLVLPAMLTVPIGWAFATGLRPAEFDGLRVPHGPRIDAGGAFHRIVAAGRVVLPVALVVSLGWSAFVWTQVRLTPDDGYRQVYEWLHRNAPQGEALAVTTDPQEFLFQGYVINAVSTPQAIVDTKSRYVVISSKQIADGYTRNGVAIAAWLRANARPVFVVEGRTYGRLEVYEVPPPKG